jgi:N utilization substance protein B
MASRRSARLAAVQTLYAADVRDTDARALASENDLIPDYGSHLVDQVTTRREEIDQLLLTHAIGWPPERMSPVDRNVLRVAVLELLEGDVPPAAVIDEAVEIAKELSGEEARRFVNGVLSGVLAERQALGSGSPEA